MTDDADTVLNVTVTYLDGTTEDWEDVDQMTIGDHTLRLEINYDDGGYRHVGIPLTAIRNWEARS